MLRAFRRSGAAGIAPVKIADTQHAQFFFSHGAFQCCAAAGELSVAAGKPRTNVNIILVCEPKAEAGFKVMVSGKLIIVAEALRAVPCQAYGNSALILGEAGMQHILSPLFIQKFCFFKTVHKSPPRAFSALLHRERNRGAQKKAHILKW